MDGRGNRAGRVSNFGLDFESTSQNMDGVDSNMVLEVPDTPDSLVMRRRVDRSSRPSWERNNFRLDANPNYDPVRRTFASRSRKSSCRNLIGSSNASNDAEFFFKEANLARQLPDTTETKSSTQSQSRLLELGYAARVPNGSVKNRETIDLSRESPITVSDHTRCQDSWQKNGGSLSESRITLSPSPVENEKIEKLYGDNAGLKSRDKGKGVDLCSNSKFRNGCISPGSVERTNISSDVGCQNVSNSAHGLMCSSSTGIGNQDNEKGMDLCRKSELVNGQPRHPRSAQRKLVRNGCISPLNIERSRNFAKQKEVEVSNNGGFSHQVHIISPGSQDKHPDKMKGKVIAEDIVAANNISSHPNSVHQLPGKEVTAISDVEGGGRRFEDKGWRTTRNHMRNSSPDSILVQDSQDSLKETRRINGKRKLGSSHSRVGECSSSVSNDLESLNIGSSRQSLNLRATRSRRSRHDGLILGPVIEVDELQSPQAVFNSTDRDRQLESDEMLARQLQEELYKETPGIGNTNEIDAGIALLLQENDGRSTAVARRHQFRPEDLSSSSTRSRYRRTPARETIRARAPTSSRLAQLRRDYQRTMMNMRLEIMGAAAFVDGNSVVRMNNILHSHRDFNEDDYEMLLALDENNHQHGGASESQINSLPQSIIQNADSQEACTVCLEPPAVGDTIRHLPCLHKFHKECIDAWLRRKRSCPICKSDIRGTVMLLAELSSYCRTCFLQLLRHMRSEPADHLTAYMDS